MIIALDNNLDELPRLTSAVEAFVAEQRMSDRDAFELSLVLEEIFANIVSHGFDGPTSRAIEVSLEPRDRAVRVQVADTGRPYDPRSVPPPDITAEVEDRPIGGLGIHLVRRLTENLVYERRADTNYLSFDKMLKEA